MRCRFDFEVQPTLTQVLGAVKLHSLELSVVMHELEEDMTERCDNRDSVFIFPIIVVFRCGAVLLLESLLLIIFDLENKIVTCLVCLRVACGIE